MHEIVDFDQIKNVKVRRVVGRLVAVDGGIIIYETGRVERPVAVRQTLAEAELFARGYWGKDVLKE